MLIEEKFANFGVVANAILIVICLITNVDFSKNLTFVVAFAFFLNVVPIFFKDFAYKFNNLFKIVYLSGIFLSLILLPSFFYFNNVSDPIWSVHFCVSLIFAMILLDWNWLLLLLFLGVFIGFMIAGNNYTITSEKLIILLYQVLMVGCIWYFFYCLRLKQIFQKKEELKNITLSVAHELNTPLSSCLLKIEKIKNNKNINNNDDLNSLENNIKHILVMIDLINRNFNEYIPDKSKEIVSINQIIESSLANNGSNYRNGANAN
jgi:signal transduction histidine kinase